MLDPTGLGIKLRKLPLRNGVNRAILIQKQGAGTGSSLVKCKNVTHRWVAPTNLLHEHATLGLLMSGERKEQTASRYLLVLILLASATFLVSAFSSPPHLMDDVDGAQAQLARTMLQTGDWVTGKLDGVIFL